MKRNDMLQSLQPRTFNLLPCFPLIPLCHINYEMKPTVGFTSSPNVVIGDPVACNVLDPR